MFSSMYLICLLRSILTRIRARVRPSVSQAGFVRVTQPVLPQIVRDGLRTSQTRRVVRPSSPCVPPQAPQAIPRRSVLYSTSHHVRKHCQYGASCPHLHNLDVRSNLLELSLTQIPDLYRHRTPIPLTHLFHRRTYSPSRGAESLPLLLLIKSNH